MHAAERQLLSARHTAQRRAVVTASHAAAQAGQASAAAAVRAKYADKLARLEEAGDAGYSARARIRFEEAVELEQLALATQTTAAAQRNAALASLRSSQKAERAHLLQRQRRQRAALAVETRRRRRRLGETHRVVVAHAPRTIHAMASRRAHR